MDPTTQHQDGPDFRRPAGLTGILRARFQAAIGWPAPVRPLVWLPGLAYCLCLDRVLLRGVELSSPAHRLEAGGFLIAQTLLLILLLALIDALLSTGARRFFRLAYVTCVYLFFGALYVDTALYHLMALHLPRGLAILFAGGPSRVGRNWADTGVAGSAVWVWAGWGAGVIVCIVGFAVASARPWFEKGWRISLGPLLLVGAYLLLVCQILSSGDDTQWIWSLGELKAALPVYFGARVPLPGRKYRVPCLAAPCDAASTMAALGPHEAGTAARPDIFVLVLESVRGDFITPQITPNLAAFSGGCLRFADTLASGNASHISWYSLLTANDGLRFGAAKRAARRSGSVPLALFKRAGYSINVLCSSTLDYHEIDRIAFGEKLQLCDRMFDAQKQHLGDAPARDLAVNGALLQALDQPAGGRLFLVFYHSTHHDYDWPATEPAPFTPYAHAWSYADFSIGKQQLGLIMNRYRNALHFQDRLLGDVLSLLKRKGQFSRAIIVVTGDHGEEFLEHGRLLHASNLYRPQTQVPLLLRLPPELAATHPLAAPPPLASHVDVLPTLLDCLGIQASNFCDGESLLRAGHTEVVITAENADADPVRFCIQSPRYKAFFQYESATRATAQQHTLYLKTVTDMMDRPVDCDPYSLGGVELLRTNFAASFQKLYPGANLGGAL
jgi:membrane-anchored protein YejM (alkaline phosphatase superfamily)